MGAKQPNETDGCASQLLAKKVPKSMDLGVVAPLCVFLVMVRYFLMRSASAPLLVDGGVVLLAVGLERPIANAVPKLGAEGEFRGG